MLVVGGGAVGTSIAYHLARFGWEDTMLLERDDTSGSTWHAAGLAPVQYVLRDYSFHQYSVEFTKHLRQKPIECRVFNRVTRMAQTQARMDEYMVYATTAETCGFPTNGYPAQIKERYPLVRTADLVGAIYHPTDGLNPADVTMAMAKGARQRGVMLERKWQADGYEWTGSEWKVTLTKMLEQGGNLIPSNEQIVIHAEHVVTATGNHAQRTARLLGIKTPAIPVEHQFIVTEPDPALVEWRQSNGEHPVLRDADAKWYVREERGAGSWSL